MISIAIPIKKVKLWDGEGGKAINDEAQVDGVQEERRKVSFRDMVVWGVIIGGPKSEVSNIEDWYSKDENEEEDDDPECPTIFMSMEDKK